MPLVARGAWNRERLNRIGRGGRGGCIEDLCVRLRVHCALRGLSSVAAHTSPLVASFRPDAKGLMFDPQVVGNREHTGYLARGHIS